MLPSSHLSYGSSVTRPVSQLQAVRYNELGSATPVWNLNQVNYYVWINLTPSYAQNAQVYEIAEVLGEDKQPNVLTLNAFEHCSTCWIRVTAQMLNMKSGKHTYKLSFVDTCTNDTFFLFISYIIQDDNPDKPYVYMTPQVDQPEDIWIDMR